jgi:hypothetical protein
MKEKLWKISRQVLPAGGSAVMNQEAIPRDKSLLLKRPDPRREFIAKLANDGIWRCVGNWHYRINAK